MKKLIRKAFFLVFLATIPLTFSQTQPPARVWIKLHLVLHDIEANQQIAELTRIITGDNSHPVLERVLLQDSESRKWVLRTESDNQISWSSFKFLATGEEIELKFQQDGQDSFAVNGTIVSFQEDQRTATSVQAQAQQLLSSATPGFQAAFMALIQRMLAFEDTNEPRIEVSKDLFFPSMPVPAMMPAGVTVSESKKNFNPQVDLPTSFDSQFGSAYTQ